MAKRSVLPKKVGKHVELTVWLTFDEMREIDRLGVLDILYPEFDNFSTRCQLEIALKVASALRHIKGFPSARGRVNMRGVPVPID